jgi:hypothetical protein
VKVLCAIKQIFFNYALGSETKTAERNNFGNSMERNLGKTKCDKRIQTISQMPLISEFAHSIHSQTIVTILSNSI